MVALGRPQVALKAPFVPFATQSPPPAVEPTTLTGRRMVVASGAKLRGEITANGAKNAATKMIASALLTREPVVLDNVPNIDAIRVQADLLRSLGAVVEFDPRSHQMTIIAEKLDTSKLSAELATKERATFVLVGPLLARLGECEAPRPGGCNIGERPVDVHIRGLSKMGVEMLNLNGTYKARTAGLRGARIYLDYPSHTGTESLMMAAVLAEGTTTILNACCEPEVVALAEHLTRMGAMIRGAGTGKIEIVGVHALHGTRTRVMPDRIEAGSFAIAAAATGGDVTIRKVVPEHLDSLMHKLDECGAEVFARDDALLVRRNRPLNAVEVQAMHYPGFPTDLQAPFCAMLTQAAGESIVYERVFDDRFGYVDELRRLGGRIDANGVDGTVRHANKAYVHGPTKLSGAAVTALDLRCGIALTIAGLVAEGSTIIGDYNIVERGYEDLTGRFRSLGANLLALD
ncbi:MAG: UDP-N-acetylglucosamine 1-carboxyvinyltransferase [Chloroflexota bacterium]